ncbi:MAG: hypothetical protein IIA55_05365 [Gemmatimonadetes bacterium]|nr:hypothetical protein [Gemmatimonadota bacterium]MCH8144126.1 hypothetical protein [Gemmatimonadota bacterium]MCH8934451.1 hypothetical protein [Gemmatimonadota bacterium]
MKLRGRGWVAVWLLSFLGVLTWVVFRQTASHVITTELRDAQQQRSALEAQRAELLRRIQEAGSRAVLVPRAESLGLRLPADSEIIILHVPSREGH